jgi:formylglycine-generating enzyme required for sulfatase activity
MNIQNIYDVSVNLLKNTRNFELLSNALLMYEDIKNDIDTKKYNEINELITNIIGTKEQQEERYNKYIKDLMIDIPEGEFIAGSPETEPERCLVWNAEDEKCSLFKETEQQHKVKLDKFLMSKYLVTFNIFDKLVKENNFTFENCQSYLWDYDNEDWNEINGINYTKDVNGKNIENLNSNKPVIHINWYESYIFARLLGCDLPTSAQWEYASRAGTTTVFSNGNNITTDDANYDGEDTPYNGGEKGKRIKDVTEVGSYKSNNFGLYDMHGNVFEWCNDFDGNYYKEILESDEYIKNGYIKNPLGLKIGTRKILRGGSYESVAVHLRNARHGSGLPNCRYPYAGMRLVRNT